MNVTADNIILSLFLVTIVASFIFGFGFSSHLKKYGSSKKANAAIESLFVLSTILLIAGSAFALYFYYTLA
jgi:hypothetical protein